MVLEVWANAALYWLDGFKYTCEFCLYRHPGLPDLIFRQMAQPPAFAPTYRTTVGRYMVDLQQPRYICMYVPYPGPHETRAAGGTRAESRGAGTAAATHVPRLFAPRFFVLWHTAYQSYIIYICRYLLYVLTSPWAISISCTLGTLCRYLPTVQYGI